MLVQHYSSHFGYRNKHLPPPMKTPKTDIDVIRENHKFLWDIDDEEELASDWGKRLAKSYYDKLFKEYCITDLERYKENKIALRWRTEDEVIRGKGQFFCAEKHCNQQKRLESWEVNFRYKEDNMEKNALVKLRLCPICSLKLNFNHQRKKAKKSKEAEKKPTTSTLENNSIKNVNNQNSSSDQTTIDYYNTEQKDVKSNIWNCDKTIPLEKSKTEEFDEFLNDLFS